MDHTFTLNHTPDFALTTSTQVPELNQSSMLVPGSMMKYEHESWCAWQMVYNTQNQGITTFEDPPHV